MTLSEVSDWKQFKDIHLSRLQECGYSRAEANTLFNSGFRPVSLPILDSDPLFLHLRLTGEFGRHSADSDWNNLRSAYKEMIDKRRHWPDQVLGYMVCDFNYKLFYEPLPLRPLAVYGCDGTDFGTPWAEAVDLEPGKFLRVHTKAVPTWIAHSVDDLMEINVAFEKGAEGGTRMFRGQVRPYELPRELLVKEFLYGPNTVVTEPSLKSGASRSDFDADKAMGYLFLDLQQMMYQWYDIEREALQEAMQMASLFHLPEKRPSVQPTAGDVHRYLTQRPGAGGVLRELAGLAQHYGIPTNGIDLTSELMVGCWFATNRLTKRASGAFGYESFDWSNLHPRVWPVVYYFSIPDWATSHFNIQDDILPSAVRPHRQGAYLATGGWGWHQNNCAEWLVAAAQLAPDFNPRPDYDTRWLFPSPEEDPFYDRLLELKARHSGSENLREDIYRRVLEFVH